MNECAIFPGLTAVNVPVNVGRPRSIVSVDYTTALILERDTDAVVRVFDSDNDGIFDDRQLVASANGLNHGLAIHDGHIYASSDTTVYRWSFDDSPIFDSVNSNTVEVVITNINADGNGGAPQGHETRTLAFDNSGRLYVSVGSDENIDNDSFRARIRRFTIDDPTVFPMNFLIGEIFADGLRNEVAMSFDKHDVLWGLGNGADNLIRSDLGGDIHNNNPGEEMHQIKEELAGKHWGYPWCWTEYIINPQNGGLGRGTVWAWPSFLNTVITDEQCRDVDEYEPAQLVIQAHSAPLGMTFYNYKPDVELRTECKDTNGISTAFPQSFDGYAFVAYHGSWNRDVPTGYKVVAIPMTAAGNLLNGMDTEPIDILAHVPPNAQWRDGFRPVDVDFDECGRLLVTSDGTNGNGDRLVLIEATATLEESTCTYTVPGGGGGGGLFNLPSLASLLALVCPFV